MPSAIWTIGGRELTRAARTSGPWLRRSGFLIVSLILLAGGMSLESAWAGQSSAGGGRIFAFSVWWAFLAAVISGPVLAADMISGERRGGTLDLLFLAGVRPTTVLLGKLLAAGAEILPAVLAVVPVLVLPVLLGGVPAAQVLAVVLALAVTAWCSLAVALCCSACVNNGRLATGLSLMILGGWMVACRIVAVLAPGVAPSLAAWSPAELVLMLTSLGAAGAVPAVRPALFSLTVIGAGWLVLACLAAEYRRHPWIIGLEARLGGLAQAASRLGRPRSRKHSLMDRDPLAWLVARERLSGLALLGAVLGGFLLWLVSVHVWTDFWLGRPELLLAAAFVLMGFVKLWLALDTTRSLAEDRSTGAVQLLLSTGMPPDEVIQGLERGLVRRYLPTMAVVLALTLGSMLLMIWSTGDATRPFLLLCLACLLFVFDAFALMWTGLHDGLVCDGPVRALASTVFKTMVLPWMAVGPMAALLVSSSASRIEPVFLLGACWFFVGFLADGILVALNGPRLAERLHHCAIGLDEKQPGAVAKGVSRIRLWVRSALLATDK